MQQSNYSISALVDMYRRGELRLPEMQRGYVWRATRVRDLLDSLYRKYPSGSILMWETDAEIVTRETAVAQTASAFGTTKLLLDGQQRLTSLAAVLCNEPLKVGGRKRPIRILFNLDHPSELPQGLEVEGDDPPPSLTEEETSEGDEEEEEQFDRLNERTFVVGSRPIEAKSNWISDRIVAFIAEKSRA